MIFKTLSLALIILAPHIFANELKDCGNNEQAIALVKLIQNDQRQKRSEIRCNKILSDVALAKAMKMADFGLVMHNLGGSPNSNLSKANYKLPDYYGTDFNSNQVEAIAGGYSEALEVWNAFKRSDAHRTHLLGDHEFYLEQDEIGVAFFADNESRHIEYWVVYLTKGFKEDQVKENNFKEIPNKGIFILQKDDFNN